MREVIKDDKQKVYYFGPDPVSLIDQLRAAVAEMQEREKAKDPDWKPKHEVKVKAN